jgi:hypothetical protein
MMGQGLVNRKAKPGDWGESSQQTFPQLATPPNPSRNTRNSSQFSHVSHLSSPPHRMNHHHYQQRLNHQQIQQQIPPPQLHGNRSGLGLGQPQHQVPPPIIPKQHLHQNIATLNQKPPQHVTSQNSQIQPAQRLSYESEYPVGLITKF